ncbi:MAG TPA: spermidine/putrescine ABC transporter permease, partial [Microbacteriaceae bacterium]|nr:spermidine/putrescine ABC transporter permease [Microbacteriaceae bacterium]
DYSRPLSTYLFQRSRIRLLGLLALPMTWLVGVYIVSLALLLVTAF